MYQIKNKNVLITGGASGIGKIMGRICLEKGAANLVIWDINEQNMETTKAELEQGATGKVRTFKVNVTDSGNIKDAYTRVKEAIGHVDMLINCAGIVKGNNTFDRQTEQDIRLTMDINATAPMLVALEMLPDMLKRDEGQICNISSAAGMLGVPRLSVYVASKWAVVGWSESMRIELKQMKSRVHVTTIAPYFINTGMFDGVNSRVFPILEPEKVAATIIRAIEKEKDFKGMPFPFHFFRLCQAFLPNALFDIIIGKWFGVYKVMDHFTGRKNK